jgi:hypothetical protein
MSNISQREGTENRTKKELEAISQKIKASRLSIKDILIPLVTGLILLMLGVFVFVPMIKTAMVFRKEYTEIKEKEAVLEKLEDELKSIEQTKFQTDLLNTKEVIPKTLRVSSFMYYIDTLANEKKLSSTTISAGDVQVTITRNIEDAGEQRIYLGVSGPLSYTGTLKNLLDFLDSLYLASPYIVSADNVSLRREGEGWRVTMNLTGYYVPESTVKVDFYEPFENYSKYEEIIDIFAEKAEQLR